MVDTRRWKIQLRREAIVDDVLERFGRDVLRDRNRLFQATRVRFVDATGEDEEGEDEGGLTVEMFSSFFREMLSPAARSSSGSPKMLTARACRAPTRPPTRSSRAAAC